MQKRNKIEPYDRISLFPIVREAEGKGSKGKDEVVEKISLLNGLTATVTRRGHYPTLKERVYKKARVYLYISNESLAENLVNRRNRPVAEWKKIVQQVLWHYKMDTKFSWNQNAGCTMCPCSPGFILDGYRDGTIYIEVDYADNLLNDGNKEDLDWYKNQFGISTPTFEQAIAKNEVYV